MRKTKQHKNTLLAHLGDAIRSRRVDIGITQQELATATDLHRTYITDVEAGHRNLSMLTYSRVTEALLCALSLPLREAEKAMARKSTLLPLYGVKGGLSKTSKSLHSSSRFCLDLNIIALELLVKANMSMLQVTVESFARKNNTYPKSEQELDEALGDRVLINPFNKKPELPSIGSALSEEVATKTPCFLRPGEIEYSPMNKGGNYIIRSGGVDGTAVAGPSPGSTYVLSGNLRTNNQP